MVERTRNELREQLDALNELLPTPIETGRDMNEQEMLAEIITAAASPNQHRASGIR